MKKIKVDFIATIDDEQVKTSYEIKEGITEQQCDKILRSGSLAILRYLKDEVGIIE